MRWAAYLSACYSKVLLPCWGGGGVVFVSWLCPCGFAPRSPGSNFPQPSMSPGKGVVRGQRINREVLPGSGSWLRPSLATPPTAASDLGEGPLPKLCGFCQQHELGLWTDWDLRLPGFASTAVAPSMSPRQSRRYCAAAAFRAPCRSGSDAGPCGSQLSCALWP